MPRTKPMTPPPTPPAPYPPRAPRKPVAAVARMPGEVRLPQITPATAAAIQSGVAQRAGVARPDTPTQVHPQPGPGLLQVQAPSFTITELQRLGRAVHAIKIVRGDGSTQGTFFYHYNKEDATASAFWTLAAGMNGRNFAQFACMAIACGLPVPSLDGRLLGITTLTRENVAKAWMSAPMCSMRLARDSAIQVLPNDPPIPMLVFVTATPADPEPV